MSPGLMKMWWSLGALFAMFISVFFVYIGRLERVPRFIRVILLFIAFFLILVSGFVVFLVVFSGPVQK